MVAIKLHCFICRKRLNWVRTHKHLLTKNNHRAEIAAITIYFRNSTIILIFRSGHSTLMLWQSRAIKIINKSDVVLGKVAEQRNTRWNGMKGHTAFFSRSNLLFRLMNNSQMEQIAGLCDTWNVFHLSPHKKASKMFLFNFWIANCLSEQLQQQFEQTFSLNCHNNISVNYNLRHIFYVRRFFFLCAFRVFSFVFYLLFLSIALFFASLQWKRYLGYVPKNIDLYHSQCFFYSLHVNFVQTYSIVTRDTIILIESQKLDVSIIKLKIYLLEMP